MPVQPVISLEQIVIIVAFLLLLIGLMWMIKRHRGGISNRLHPARRMQHLEDLSLAPQQRLHLIEVDGRTFLVHAGKGHAASFIAVDGTEPVAAEAHTSPRPRRAEATNSQKQAGKSAGKSAANQAGKSDGKSAGNQAKPKSAFAAAIAAARRNNPSLEFGK